MGALWMCLWVTAFPVLVDSATPSDAISPLMSNETWTDKLKLVLLSKYDKFARPAQHTNTTEVEFGLVIKHVEVDELRSMMVINAWTNLQWEDEKLRWNASEYGGLQKLSVGDHEIWQPDIVLYNSAATTLDHYANTHCLVQRDGRVLWVPPSQFSVYCDINLRKWPYDSHTCKFFFGSWVYDGTQISLKRRSKSSPDGEVDMEPCEWTVLSVKEIEHIKYYNCCVEPYYAIEVIVSVQRHSPSYAPLVFIPAFVSAILVLSVFWLPPPSATEKFFLCGLTSAISCMFLMYFSHRLPTMGVHTPLIVEFYGYTLLLTGLAVVVSVVTVSLSRRPRHSSSLPWILTRLLRSRPLTTFLILPKNEDASQDVQELYERRNTDVSTTESIGNSVPTRPLNNYDRDWIILSIAIDRIMFLLYLFIFICITIVFSYL